MERLRGTKVDAGIHRFEVFPGASIDAAAETRGPCEPVGGGEDPLQQGRACRRAIDQRVALRFEDHTLVVASHDEHAISGRVHREQRRVDPARDDLKPLARVAP
jgi:hypothetical protein